MSSAAGGIDNDAAARVCLLGNEGRDDALLGFSQALTLLPPHFLHHPFSKAEALGICAGDPCRARPVADPAHHKNKGFIIFT